MIRKIDNRDMFDKLVSYSQEMEAYIWHNTQSRVLIIDQGGKKAVKEYQRQLLREQPTSVETIQERDSMELEHDLGL